MPAAQLNIYVLNIFNLQGIGNFILVQFLNLYNTRTTSVKQKKSTSSYQHHLSSHGAFILTAIVI